MISADGMALSIKATMVNACFALKHANFTHMGAPNTALA
jgi:hypothetical protein